MKYRLFILVAVLIVIGAGCNKTSKTQSGQVANQDTVSNTTTNRSTPDDSLTQNASVRWFFDGTNWHVNGTPPACPSPLVVQTPVDLSLATAILYPGQSRGGNYKAHGGFRFDRSANAAITVTAPMDAIVYNASRYLEAGEIQYLFTFINSCGVAFRFDHMLTLSPTLQVIAETLPAPGDTTQTTLITSGATVKAGDVLATAVGFSRTKNVSVDFGLYDLRNSNGTTTSPEYGQHGLCWLNHLSPADVATVKSLPAGDQTAGKTSDYCR